MDKDRICLGGGLHCLATVVRDDIFSLYFSLGLHIKCQCLDITSNVFMIPG